MPLPETLAQSVRVGDRRGDLSHGTPGRTDHPAASIALCARPSHLAQTTSIPKTLRGCSYSTFFKNCPVKLACVLATSSGVPSATT
jgi:hypothetical protein